MSADDDIRYVPAPAPATDLEDLSPKRKETARAEVAKSKSKNFVVGLVVFALIAGGACFFLVKKLGGGTDAASASTEAVTDVEESPEDVATATESDDSPAECTGEVVEEQHRWYCEDFLPFAKKASADHDRLDRLEAAGKDVEDRGESGAPLWFVFLLFVFGIITTYNTVKIHSKKKNPPAG